MINMVLDYWVTTFTEKFKREAEDMRFQVVQKAPFQDDPLRKAPYLSIGINDDPNKGLQPVVHGEIGGAAYWKVHMRAIAQPKPQRTLDMAYSQLDLLTQRMIYIIQDRTFAHPTAQNLAFMDNFDWFTIDAIQPKVYGGEGEWLAKLEVLFYTQVKQPGPYPYGQYP